MGAQGQKRNGVGRATGASDHGAACLIDSDVRRTRNESTGGGASPAAGSWRLSLTTGGLPCDPGGNSTRSGFYGCHYSSRLVFKL
jgi:hypothetical protein